MSPVPSWLHLVLDTPRAGFTESVAFWTAATGCEPSASRGELNQFVTLVPATGDSWVRLQSVDGDAPRIHLDLAATDRGAALERSTSLGARAAWVHDGVPVMRSPGGLLFRHTLGNGPRHLARDGAATVLDQVCIDIPAKLWDSEVEFWRAITGRELERGLRPEFAFLGDTDPHGGLRILLQRLDHADSAVSAHPDFAVANRPEETARHTALGAHVVDVLERWTVLQAPDSRPYCLTDRDPSTGRVRG